MVFVSVIIDLEKCVGCGKCKSVCGVGAIQLENRKAVVNHTCVECGRCIRVCPREAIRFNLVKKEATVEQNQMASPTYGFGCGRGFRQNNGQQSCSFLRRMFRKVNPCRGGGRRSRMF